VITGGSVTPPETSPKLTELYNPFLPPQLDDPGPVWARSREECPVFFSPVISSWVVTRYEDILGVLRNPDVFGPGIDRKMFGSACPEAEKLLSQLPPLGSMKVHSSEPPVHTKLRRYLQPALLPHKIGAMEPELRRLANKLIDEFEPRGQGDFYQDYAYRFPLEVIAHLIGLPRQDLEQIRIWTDLQAELRYGDPSPAEQVALAQSQVDQFRYVVGLVAQRRRKPGDDFLSWIIADSDASDDPLTDEQLASQATSLLTGGHETTSHFLTMLIHRLLKDRRYWEILVADPAQVPALVEEALRTDGPVQSLWRRAKVDTEVGGVRIPAGDRLSLALGSANLDPSVFGQPDAYDPGRPDVSRHVAFGRGIHTCVGAGVARLESRITLELLSSRLPRMRLAEDDGYTFKPGATQRMAERLYLEWS
jgi:cytochrome P450